MMIAIRQYRSEKEYYGLKLILTLFLFISILAYTGFYLMQNVYSKSFMALGMGHKTIYILTSPANRRLYERNGMDYGSYLQRIERFKKMAAEAGYQSRNVEADDLKGLPPRSTLLAMDMMSLSSDEMDQIDTFVRQGGRLLFNFTAGFLDAELHTRTHHLVETVTGLRLDPKINMLKLDPKQSAYLTLRLLSPLAINLTEGQALDFGLYDLLPVYDNNASVATDAYLTNWSQDDYVHYDQDHTLNRRQSGLIWHGYHGKGKWIYFSFPSYLFLDSQQKYYNRLFKNMLAFLDRRVCAVAYPLIDRPNAVFVSEDTEYKFEYLDAFSDAARKHRFPVTAFCVARLAKKHRELMHDVGQNPYLEIGSHSYSHKKIVGESDAVYRRETFGSKKLLESLTGKKVLGFRPPREEIDEKLIRDLDEAGFTYILSAGENRLYPYYHGKILIIPRHGTDDYSYLVNLDWDASKILARMKHEAQILVSLNGIYTLSTHTHLMSFGPNIKITEKFFDFVHTRANMHPMNGEMIAKRVAQRLHLSYKMDETARNSTLTIYNNGKKVISNLHFALHSDSPIVGVESEIVGITSRLRRIDKHRYTLIIDKIDPDSHLTLFIKHEKDR